MNILITGAAGHIGSYLMRELSSKIKKKIIFFLDNFLLINIIHYLILIKKN